MWRTWWFRKNGSVPSDSVVEDIELTWKTQKYYLVNYNPDATCFTENLETLNHMPSRSNAGSVGDHQFGNTSRKFEMD
jgi:cellulose synthase/poly-beta-1,6-N-acetylglucosamine synthase-like glycosyltransferase